MNQEAIALVKKCLDTQDPYLDLGRLGLRDEDFAAGTELDSRLSMCKHITKLILSNYEYEWDDKIGWLSKTYSFKQQNEINKLNRLPPAILHLDKIEIFSIEATSEENHKWGIRDLSYLIGHKKLRELYANNNEIYSIKEIVRLPFLEVLYIEGNQISEINNLSLLKNLKRLDIQQNKLANILDFPKLPYLKILNLGENRITKIGTIDGLPSLTSLRLEGCPIEDIKNLSGLTSLEYLNLVDTRIKDIRPLSGLTNLEVLNLENNQIEDIRSLSGLTNLEVLNLENNQIEDIRPLSGLASLEKLGLNRNKITNISPLLPFLKRANNPLMIKHSSDFDSYEENFLITINNNPLSTPPIEVIKQGNAAVLRYFEKIAKEGQDYIYEAKLILVGEGSAGKTSLQVRLQDAKAKLPRQDKRTRGIQIADWPFKTSKGRPHIAHIWDFGGQDVYYPVHRFFLTENAVFVLLASTRQTTHNFDYWIPTIFQFGGKSPIILGQTCHDGNKVAWNDLGYYMGSDNFNIIKTGVLPYQELNLINKNEGLAKIKKTIVEQLTSLPHYGKGVPKTWVAVRDKIAAMAPKTACIPFSQFKVLCRAISKDGFADAIAVDDCASFLHSIGVVLWYADIAGLKDWVVLQPEWAMKAVYKIIDDADIQNRRGIILAKDFKRLWSEGCYEGMHDVLKQMLEIFKIAFPKKHPKGDYIIPARLLSMPAEDRWQIAEPCLRLEYKYEFMPRGMVNQLSAELSRYIIADEQVWNDAVNFKINEASCQVTEDFYNRFIRIFATGKDARALVMLVMNGLQDITDGYRGVTPQIIVPCTCKKCEKSAKPINFEYDRLLEWSREREQVTCNNSGENLRIDDLLYHVGLRNPLKETKTRGMKKIFISYSKHDEEFKEEFHSHLVTLREQGLAHDFNCKQIDLGAEWDPAIQQEIDDCDIMICLVSKGFLNTYYIRNNEVKVALEKGKQVIPVIIKPCDWENSDIGQLYAPLRGKPVSLNHEKLLRNIIEETTPIERDAHWNNIIKELREKVFK